MIWVGVSSLLPPPTWNSENEHGWQSVHWASAAAIFMGWYLASTTPSSLPTNMARMMAGSRTTSEILAVWPKAATDFCLRRCQADTASIMSAPVTVEASRTWAKPQRNTGLVNRAPMLLSSARPVLELMV